MSWKTRTKSNLLAVLILLFVFDAMASKSDVTLIPKRVVYQYEKIEDTLGTITPRLTLQGFVFKEITLNLKANCTQYERFFFKVATLYLKDEEKRKNEIMELLNRCPNVNNIFLRTLLQIGKKDLQTENDFKKFLKRYVSDKKEHKKILGYYRAKRENKFRRDVLPIFSELVANFDKKENFYDRHVELLSKLKEMPGSILNSLSQMLIAMKGNNKGWAKKLFDDVLKQNHQSLIFDMETSFFHSDSQHRRFFERLETLKEIIEDNLDDETLANMLILSIDELLPTFVKEQSSVKWSLREIRDLSKKQKYGGRYPWFWFTRLYGRSSEVEASTFLKNIMTSNFLQREGKLFVPAFEYYFPTDVKIRKVALQSIRSLLKSKNDYDQYLVLHLLKNKVIKRELTKNNYKYRRTMVTLERSYYRQLISKGVAINFSLYNLFLLGDFDEELLWWVVL